MQYDRITIISSEAAGETGVRMVLRVEKDGMDVTPAGLNPYTVVNPPTMVADPHGDVERVSYRPDPAGDVVRSEVVGDRVVTRTYTEVVEVFAFDPRRAIEEVIRQHIAGL